MLRVMLDTHTHTYEQILLKQQSFPRAVYLAISLFYRLILQLFVQSFLEDICLSWAQKAIDFTGARCKKC